MEAEVVWLRLCDITVDTGVATGVNMAFWSGGPVRVSDAMSTMCHKLIS